MDFSILQQEYLWGVTLGRLVVAGVAFALSLFARPLVRRLLRRLLGARRLQDISWAQDLDDTLPSPISLVVHLGIWYGIAALLQLPTAPVNVQDLVQNGLLIAVAIAGSIVLFRLIDVGSHIAERQAEATETRLDDQLVPLGRKAAKILLVFVLAVVFVERLGYSPASLLASLSIGGLALALAAKDTVANLFGSAVLFADQPFHVGDWIVVAGTEGEIEEIGLRVTRIRQADRSLATIPNQSFTTDTVINYSVRPHRRLRHVVPFRHPGSTETVTNFIEAVRSMMASTDNIDAASVQVFLDSIQDSGLGILVQALTLSPELVAFRVTQEEVLMNVLRIAEESGIKVSFPAGTLFLHREDRD